MLKLNYYSVAKMSSVKLDNILRRIEESKSLILALEKKINEAKQVQEDKLRQKSEQWSLLSMKTEALRLSAESELSDAEFKMELDQLERDIREVKETLEKNKRELNEL